VDILCDGGTKAGLTLKSMLALAKAEGVTEATRNVRVGVLGAARITGAR
jgi:hypothetical protein